MSQRGGSYEGRWKRHSDRLLQLEPVVLSAVAAPPLRKIRGSRCLVGSLLPQTLTRVKLLGDLQSVCRARHRMT